MFYTVSYLSLSELTTHTILDLGLVILNLAVSTTTVILFTECCLQTILTFLSHLKCYIFSPPLYTFLPNHFPTHNTQACFRPIFYVRISIVFKIL